MKRFLVLTLTAMVCVSCATVYVTITDIPAEYNGRIMSVQIGKTTGSTSIYNGKWEMSIPVDKNNSNLANVRIKIGETSLSRFVNFENGVAVLSWRSLTEPDLPRAVVTESLPVAPVVSTENDFDIKQNAQGTITITGYHGTVKDVVIPEKIKGIKVTEIGASAFAGKQLTGVTIPNSVIVIGNAAFSSSQMAPNYFISVTIPDSVTTIGDFAFAGNTQWSGALTSVIIPNSVKKIGIAVFQYNQLTNITIPNSVTTIGSSAFAHNKLTSVIIPNSITTIGAQAFSENQLTSVIIPGSVTAIEYAAFGYNQITSVTIGNSNIRFEDRPFLRVGDQNQITSITIPANAHYANIFPNNFSDFYISQGRKAGTYTWSGRLWKVE